MKTKITETIPVACPVCNGAGTVPYPNSSALVRKCDVCNGRGVLSSTKVTETEDSGNILAYKIELAKQDRLIEKAYTYFNKYYDDVIMEEKEKIEFNRFLELLFATISGGMA